MDKGELQILLNSGLPAGEIKELLELIFPEEIKILLARLKPEEADTDFENDPEKLGEILLRHGDISKDDLEKTLSEQQKIGEKLVSSGKVPRNKIDKALKEQQEQRKRSETRIRQDKTSNIKVNSQKLDKLFNLIGELVTVQERLSQVSGVLRKTAKDATGEIIREFDLEGISEEVSRLTNSLRDNALSIRMLPIEATFNKFKRLVHDLATNLNKDINLTMSGTETEIDKTVIDKLDEPLMHMIRNCADHGIETPEVREENGKNPTGNIHLSAEHSAGNVIIHIRDDGKGLDREKILAQAIEKSIIEPDAKLSDREIYNLIFTPGFSTAQSVTNVSGRGVGMDVVKKTIEDLRGNVNVFSTVGKGTQIDVTLPLTLAIIDGLLVSINEQAFVLPLGVVEECIELRRNEQQDKTSGGKLVNVRGKLVPYSILRDVFSIEGEPPKIEQIVIAKVNGQQIGLVVDTVIGEHKTVIKSLGKTYKKAVEFSGATIMGDGSIAIIIDPTRLVELIKRMEIEERKKQD